MSLQTCLGKFGTQFPAAERDALMAAVENGVAGGMVREAAEIAAVDSALAEAQTEHQEIIDAVVAELPTLGRKVDNAAPVVDKPVVSEPSASDVAASAAQKAAEAAQSAAESVKQIAESVKAAAADKKESATPAVKATAAPSQEDAGKSAAAVPDSAAVAVQVQSSEELSAAVDDALSKADKAVAAQELGEPHWSPLASKKFIQRYAEWLQQGARDLGTQLSDLFAKVLAATKNGVLSIAVAFNINVAQPLPSVNVQIGKLTLTQIKERPRADFKGVAASADAKITADWFVRNGKADGNPFLIADKSHGVMFAFDANGSLIAKSPALFGASKGDALTEAQSNKSIGQSTIADKITPAGVFHGKAVTGTEYGTVVKFADFKNSALAVHRVYLGTPSEKRMERLQSTTADDNRVSYGCINALPEFVDQVLVPHFAGNSQVIVLPDSTTPQNFFRISDSEFETTKTEITPDSTSADVSWGGDNYAMRSNRTGPLRAARRRKAKFSRAKLDSADTPATAAFKILAENDDLFRYPRSDARDIESIAADVDPDLKVRDVTRETKGMGPAISHVFEIKGQSNNSAEIFQTDGGLLWMNISNWHEGEGGSAIYSIAANYAHNNDLVFEGDPYGLSDVAVRRRLENMLSSALKFGTTKHLRPHEKQLEGDATLGVKPLAWKEGEDTFNLREMMQQSYDNALAKVPEIANVRYNFDARTFEHNGNPVGPEFFVERAGKDGAREARAGRNTLKRAALAGSLLREVGGEVRWRRILGELLRQSGEQLDPALVKSFYSRSPSTEGLSVADAKSEVLSELGKTKTSKIKFAASWADLPQKLSRQVFSKSAFDVQGMFDPDTGDIWILTGNIRPGEAFSVVMHEGGVHLGLEDMIGKPGIKRLANQIRSWARSSDSMEHFELARGAVARIPTDTPMRQRDEETIAYFVQDAVAAGHGIEKPDGRGPIARWFRELWQAVKSAIAKLGMDPDKLTTNDIVALARGALERSLVEKAGDGTVRAGIALSRSLAKQLENEGEEIVSLDDARRRHGAGQRIYAFHELDERHQLINNVSELDGYTPEQLLALPAKFARAGTAPVMTDRIPPWAERFTPAQQDSLRKAGVIFPDATLKDRAAALTKDFGKKFVQGVLDQFAPLRELDQNAYMKARLSKATDGGVEALMLYGKPILRDGALDVDVKDSGFLKTLQSLKGEHDRFFAWVAGQRARELKAAGKENLLTDEDLSFLNTLNRSDPSWQERQGAYQRALNDLRAFNKSVMDIAAEQGIVDGESRHLWESQFYVPFYRVMEEGTAGPSIKSGLVRQYAFKKLKGGTENLNDLLKNTLRNWSHLLSAAQKNAAAKASIEAAERAGIAVEALEDTARQMGKSIGQKNNVVWFLDHGQQRYFLIDDPYIMDAISSIEQANFGPWMKPLSALKRWLTLGVTVNPAFKIRNLIRDSIAAIGQNEISYNVWDNVVKGWKATDADSQTRASLMAGGGMFRFGTMLEGDRAQHVKRLVESGVDAGTILDTPDKFRALMRKTWDAYQEFGDRSENINRAALYEHLIAKGHNHLEASFLARDMLDFGMSGKWAAVRFLTQAVPFMNARLQGLYKLGRAAKENPARMGYVTAAIALASLALLIGNEDDDDWKKREDWDRDSYWWFKFGGVAFRIPKPFELGAIGTIAERTYELAFNKEMTGARFAQRMADIVSQNFSMSPVPQLVKPMIDLYANQDSFSGRPIETMGMENLRKQDRYGENTTYAARLIGQLGIPDPLQLVQGRYEGVSPAQADYLIRGYFGWLGTMTATALDYGIRPLVGAPSQPAMRLRDVFLAGNFAETLPTNQSRYLTELYEQSKEVEQAYNSWRQALKVGDVGRARQIYESERGTIGRYPVVEAVKRVESKITAAEHRIEMSDADPETKRAQLDALAQQKDRIARRITAVP